jgi:hypothetical protein
VLGLAAAAGLAGVLVLRPVGPEPLGADELVVLKEQSAALESELARVAPEGRVMSGREAALGALLEDRIAMIDGELGYLGMPNVAPPGAMALDLWRERVDLMQQLYTVRVTRAAYTGL